MVRHALPVDNPETDRVFISFSEDDRGFVEEELVPLLEDHGITTWRMTRDIRVAVNWTEFLVQGLEQCPWFLVVMSSHSETSKWVRDEVFWAFENREGRIIPLLLSDCKHYHFHLRMPQLQHVDYRDTLAGRRELLKVWGIDYLSNIARPTRPIAPGEAADMDLLVQKMGRCRQQGDRVFLCSYHRDRLEVRLYEDPGGDGEESVSPERIRLHPTPRITRLFQNVQSKTEVAGHWGLMQGHRDWLAQRAADFISSHRNRDLKILQCGIAGHVHYFGTLNILNQQINPSIRSVHIKTFDLCCGPILAIQGVLDLLRQAPSPDGPGSAAPTLDLGGLSFSIDSSFWSLLQDEKLLGPHVEHDLAVRDLTRQDALSDLSGWADLALSHHIFSMWQDATGERLAQFCRNLAVATRPGSEGLFAISTREVVQPIPLGRCHEIFTSHGFRIAESELVWDVYDLSYQTRSSFLENGAPLEVPKQCALIRVVRN